MISFGMFITTEITERNGINTAYIIVTKERLRYASEVNNSTDIFQSCKGNKQICRLIFRKRNIYYVAQVSVRFFM